MLPASLFDRPPSPDGLGEPPHVGVAFVDGVAFANEVTRPLEVALSHRPDAEPMKQRRAATLVTELLEDSQALCVQLCRLLVVAGDVGGAPIGAERVPEHLGIDLGGHSLEKCSEPSLSLTGIVGDPELLERRRHSKPELDPTGCDRPCQHRPQVVLLGDRDLEPLAAGA